MHIVASHSEYSCRVSMTENFKYRIFFENKSPNLCLHQAIVAPSQTRAPTYEWIKTFSCHEITQLIRHLDTSDFEDFKNVICRICCKNEKEFLQSTIWMHKYIPDTVAIKLKIKHYKWMLVVLKRQELN